MASSTSSSSGNPSSSLPVSSSSSLPESSIISSLPVSLSSSLPESSPTSSSSSLPQSSPISPLPVSQSSPISYPISTLSFTNPFSEISQPITTSISMSMPPTPSISEVHPLFSSLHQQQWFPTSTASFWMPTQPVIPRAVFSPITTTSIDQIASGLQGLNLSSGFPSHMSNNGGLPFSLPTSTPFFPSTLVAPNVTNLVTVKLTTVEDYLTWKNTIHRVVNFS